MEYIDNEEYEQNDSVYSDLPSLTTFKGYNRNFWNIGKVILDGDIDYKI